MPTPAGDKSLAQVIAALACSLPKSQRGALAAAVRPVAAPSPAARSAAALAHGADDYQRAVGALFDAWSVANADAIAAPSGAAIALALEAAAAAGLGPLVPSVEPVWSGPIAELVDARQTLGVLFGLVDEARSELTLLSFSAYRIEGLVERLNARIAQGVRVRLVLESVRESGGRLSVDATNAFAGLDRRATIYTWPSALRDAGAVMHAKAAIIDDRAGFVTSANLTEHAVSRNIELGIIVRGGSLARRLCDDIDRLIESGFLSLSH
ncbi:MAG: DISARM system phospholipase D-like protein DrmC [Vulcanimicrobiaceae bacterium]